MIDNEGHDMVNPLDVVHELQRELRGFGSIPKIKAGDFFASIHSTLINKHSKAVFANFDRMMTHLARTHHLHEDEIGILLGAWFNEQPGCLRVNIRQKQLTKEQFAKLREAVDMLLCNAVTYAEDVASGSELDELIIEHIVEPFIEPLINGRL